MKKIVYIFCLFLLSISGYAQKANFTNPLLPSGPDPYSYYKDGYYYYTHTMGRNVTIWKTKNLADLATAEKKVIFTPPAGTSYSRDLWAPEILFLRGKWYAYFAADDGKNINHRMYAVENSSPDPMQGEWVFKGKVSDSSDKWAIDGDVFEYRNQLYMIWSGWEGDTNGQQDIYIARMKNPWTIDSKRVRISVPEFGWEKFGDLKAASGEPTHVNVNEGPQALMNGKNLFIVYSASGCWTDNYSLGILRLTGTDPLDPSAWKKHSKPVFTQSVKNEVYATGHNSFFISPNGKENWILYHANSKPGQGCGNLRSPRAQKFSWNSDGTPNFGEPVKEGVVLAVPAEK